MNEKLHGFIWDEIYHNIFCGKKAFSQKLKFIGTLTKEEFKNKYPRDNQYDGNYLNIATITTSNSLINYDIAFQELRWQVGRFSLPILVNKLKSSLADSKRGRELPYAREYAVVDQWEITVPSWEFVISNSIPEEKEPEAINTFHEEFDFNRTTLIKQLELINLGLSLGYEVYTPDYTKIKNKLNCELPQEISRLNMAVQVDANEDKKVIEKIDVIWLKRGLPIHAYEIEGSTVIKSGLTRLNVLNQYIPNCKFHIVADIKRRGEYVERKSSTLFKELNVNFISYDHVNQLEALPKIDENLLHEEVYKTKMQQRLYINLEKCSFEEAHERLKKAYNTVET